MEVWNEIIGYERRYEVSSLGNVRSLVVITPRILRPGRDGCGYLTVGLWKDKSQKSYRVHRLVALAHIPNTGNKSQVNHKNGIKIDNDACNLEWMSPSENQLHACHELGLKRPWSGKFGKDHPHSKAIIQLTINGSEVAKFESAREAEQIGFNHTCISKCCLGKQLTHQGFRWAFV